MTPAELYRLLETKYPDSVVGSICKLEKNCRRQGFCERRQGMPVVDFDGVKDIFYQGRRKPSSVDAVCVSGKGKYFCFVELKGWKKYLQYEEKQKENIEETAGGYHLEEKREGSVQLCVEIAEDDSLFASMPVVFLLMTDIEVKENGIEAFANSMFALAETSSDRYVRCVTAAKNVLESQIRVEHDYICCKDFDKYVSSV